MENAKRRKIMNIRETFQEIVNDVPSAMEYETDARETWPERWERVQEVLETQIHPCAKPCADANRCMAFNTTGESVCCGCKIHR